MDGILGMMIGSPIAATIFAITLITSIRAFRDAELRYSFMFNPYQVIHGKDYKRLITHGLIHANQAHLAFNMITFFFFAFLFERMIGHWQFAVFYVAALVLSSLTTLFKYKDQPHYNSLGASGAVSAVILGVILFNPALKLYLFFFVPMPGWLFAVLYIGYSQYASRNANDNIGHEAHLWGALSGIVLTILLHPPVLEHLKNFLESSF